MLVGSMQPFPSVLPHRFLLGDPDQMWASPAALRSRRQSTALAPPPTPQTPRTRRLSHAPDAPNPRAPQRRTCAIPLACPRRRKCPGQLTRRSPHAYTWHAPDPWHRGDASHGPDPSCVPDTSNPCPRPLASRRRLACPRPSYAPDTSHATVMLLHVLGFLAAFRRI